MTITVDVAPNCPVETDKIVVTAAGVSSNPRVDADVADFSVLPSPTDHAQKRNGAKD